jgi:uncharacterized membrane protein
MRKIITHFPYQPLDNELEKASNSYLMSLVAVVAGLPLPILNLIATFFFFIANRKSTLFVKWHCTQALLSQMALMFINSYTFWWTMSLLFGDGKISNAYFATLFTAILVNLFEFISTVYAAVQVRKGKHVKFWFFGNLTDLICKSSTR